MVKRLAIQIQRTAVQADHNVPGPGYNPGYRQWLRCGRQIPGRGMGGFDKYCNGPGYQSPPAGPHSVHGHLRCPACSCKHCSLWLSDGRAPSLRRCAPLPNKMTHGKNRSRRRNQGRGKQGQPAPETYADPVWKGAKFYSRLLLGNMKINSC